MNAFNLTPSQRRVVLLMAAIIISVFSMIAGFIITSLQTAERATPTVARKTPTLRSLLPTSQPPPLTPTPIPSPSPGPSKTPDEIGLWSQVQAARLFDQIAHQVETLRELSPRAEVPLNFLDEHEMKAILRWLYGERDPEATLEPYISLGLLPETTLETYTPQAAGIYISEQRQLYVSTHRPENDIDAQALLAHAYVHALQDQHFDLEAMESRATTTDSALAIQALIEGDATLLTALYSYENPTEADWVHLTDLIVQAERLSRPASPSLREQESEQFQSGDVLGPGEVWDRLLSFPNWEGRLFATALFQDGDWEKINRAYTTPPRSTEQVIHPERYLEDPDDPTSVIIPALDIVLDEDWDMALDDTVGEFITGLYLNQTLPEERALQGAEGWDGDKITSWEHSDGRRVLVWRTIWDDTTEAAEFERSLTALIPQRYFPTQPIDAPQGLPGRWWRTQSDTEAMHVHRLARYVTFVRAPDVNTLTNVVGVLP